MTEGGETVYAQPEDDWIRVPFPPLVDEQTWDRAQAVKRQRKQRSRRNTKIFYLLQHLVTCAECGRLFACRSTTGRTVKHKGKRYRYDLETPHRHYQCYGMLRERLRCRERPLIKADQLEELVWGEVKRMIRNPELIAAGIEALDTRDEDGLDRRIARAEADLRKVQTEEERAIRLFVSGKITEDQLDQQRRFILERLEAARARLDDLRAREVAGLREAGPPGEPRPVGRKVRRGAGQPAR